MEADLFQDCEIKSYLYFGPVYNFLCPVFVAWVWVSKFQKYFSFFKIYVHSLLYIFFFCINIMRKNEGMTLRVIVYFRKKIPPNHSPNFHFSLSEVSEWLTSCSFQLCRNMVWVCECVHACECVCVCVTIFSSYTIMNKTFCNTWYKSAPYLWL